MRRQVGGARPGVPGLLISNISDLFIACAVQWTPDGLVRSVLAFRALTLYIFAWVAPREIHAPNPGCIVIIVD